MDWEAVDRLEGVVRGERGEVLATMPPDPTGELAAMPIERLLMVFGNWRARFVLARPRRVHISKELQQSTKDGEHRAALAAIRDAVVQGRDLTPHLSRDTRVAYQPPLPSPEKRRRPQ